MLKIYYGNMENVIFNTSVYFKNVYQDNWITAPIAQEMIADVDHSKVIAGGVIESPILGKIPPTGLSGGVKTLILIANKPDQVFNATNCGDNCAKWLLKLAKDRDITINLRYLMDFGKEQFDIYILNSGQVVHSMKELIIAAVEYVSEVRE